MRCLITIVNRLHHGSDPQLRINGDSGQRSLCAASLLSALGDPRALSVAGGFQAWKKLQTAG